MSATPNNPPIPRRADMRRSVLDGCAYAVMLGFGQDYLQTFALSLNKGERLTSSLLALSPLIGSVLQLSGPALIERLGSHRRWVVLNVVIQALSFLPLIIGALLGVIPGWAIIGAVAIYQYAGLAAGAAWSTWMATIIPAKVRPHFFSLRTRLLWFIALGSTLTAGWIIAAAADRGYERYGFAFILFIAMCGRLVSAWKAGRISEPLPIPPGHRHIPAREMLHKLLHGHDGRLMGYLMLTQLAVNVSLPFLNPWVIGALKYPKETWAWVAAALTVGRIFALYALPAFIKRRGVKHTLMAAGLALIPIHALFLISSDLKWILAVQFLAGVVQAAFDMAQWLMLVHHTRENERTSMFSLAYFFNVGLMPTAGWLIGLAILIYGGFRLPGTPADTYFFSPTGYLWVFAIGAAFRLATLIPMWTWVRKLPER